MGEIRVKMHQDDEGDIMDISLNYGTIPVAELKRESGTRWAMKIFGQDRTITIRVESRENIRISVG